MDTHQKLDEIVPFNSNIFIKVINNWLKVKHLNTINMYLVLLLLLLSHFSHIQLCATPEIAAHQAPLSLGFSRQKHWSVLPLPSPMHESEK